MSGLKSLKLHHWILVGLGIGAICGLWLHSAGHNAKLDQARALIEDAKASVLEAREGKADPATFKAKLTKAQETLGAANAEITAGIPLLDPALYPAIKVKTTLDAIKAKTDEVLVASGELTADAPLEKWDAVKTKLAEMRGLSESLNRPSEWFTSTGWWLDLFGKTLFIGSLKMLIAPLIFCSIISGVTSIPNFKELGAIGWKTFIYYFCSMFVAVAIGMTLALTIQPGKQETSHKIRLEREAELEQRKIEFNKLHIGQKFGDNEEIAEFARYVGQKEGANLTASESAKQWNAIQEKSKMTPGELMVKEFVEPLLQNPFASLAERNPLGIIFFAIVMGLACLSVGEAARPVVAFFQGCNEVMMKITFWVMCVSPVSLGCLVASLLAKLGTAALMSLFWYCLVVITGIALHVMVLTIAVTVLGKMNPFTFWKGIWSAWLVGFTTTSSAATMPITLKCCTDNLKLSPKVVNFTIPIGTTVNMDGTALYEGVAVIFLVQLYGGLADVPVATLTGVTLFTIFMASVFAAAGAAAVPSAGLVTMAIVAGVAGVPTYYIALIIPVDHFLDMFRTSTNILGDVVGAVLVNHWERDSLRNEELAAETSQ